MEQRIKASKKLLNLVSDFEEKLKSGLIGYIDERAYITLIEYYKDNFQIDLAIQAVNTALEQFTFRSDFYAIKARLLLVDRKPQEAIDVIESGEYINPGDQDLLLIKAIAFGQMRKMEEAFSIIEELKEHSYQRNESEIAITESYLFEQIKDFDKMFESLREVLLINPNHVEALERVWLSVELSKRYEESVKLHELLLKKDAFNALAWYNLGHAYACSGEYANAIDSLEYAFLSDSSFEIAYLDCAELCLENRKYRRAIGIYKEASELFGLDNEVLVKMADCYIRLEQYGRAKRLLKKAITLDDYDDEAFYLLAECYRHFESHVKAIKYYQKAIALEERREEYYAGIALAYFKLEDFVKAHYYFRKATEIGPEQNNHWSQHASFLLNIGEKEKALEILDEAEYHAVGSDLSYCRVACLLSLERRSEGLELLNEVLIDNFSTISYLFDIQPDLEKDKEVNSLIKYHSGC